MTGHTGTVRQVAFSHDGAQVVSASAAEHDESVRVWDVASSRQVCQFVGDDFSLVEGLSGEHKRHRRVITTSHDTLRIYEFGAEQQDAEGGAAAACFKAPTEIMSVRCHGATICVGCVGGAVCILSAPFLTA